MVGSRGIDSRSIAGDPAIHFCLENAQRQGAVAQQGIVKGANIEFRAEGDWQAA